MTLLNGLLLIATGFFLSNEGCAPQPRSRPKSGKNCCAYIEDELFVPLNTFDPCVMAFNPACISLHFVVEEKPKFRVATGMQTLTHI